MGFGLGVWIEVFTMSFYFQFGASPWSALAMARGLNFLFGKSLRFSRRDNK